MTNLYTPSMMRIAQLICSRLSLELTNQSDPNMLNDHAVDVYDMIRHGVLSAISVARDDINYLVGTGHYDAAQLVSILFIEEYKGEKIGNDNPST